MIKSILLALSCRHQLLLLTGFVLLLLGSVSLADTAIEGPVVSQIIISGNVKTQSRFVLKWAELSVGSRASQSLLDRARQNILDTELFKDVSVELEPDADNAIVHIRLEERKFTLLLPRLSRNADGDIKTGLRLRMHNIHGADQSLQLLVERADTIGNSVTRRVELEYSLPQYGKPYDYGWELARSITSSDSSSNQTYLDSAAFSVARAWNLAALSRPLGLRLALAFEQRSLRDTSPGPVSSTEEYYYHLDLKLEYDDVHNEKYRRFGRYFSALLRQGMRSLNSDFDTTNLELEARIYHSLNALDSINSRVVFGFSQNSPYQQPLYRIGGAESIRGLEKNLYAGDLLLFSNLEYVMGFQRYPSFRSSFFLDFGNVYADHNSIDLGDLQTSVGIGLRWKALSFVRTDLYVDLAHSIDTGESKLYGGTSLNF